jgi:phosphoglucomutase
MNQDKLQGVSDVVDDDDVDNNNNNNNGSKVGFEYAVLKLPLSGPGRHTQAIELYLYSFVTLALDVNITPRPLYSCYPKIHSTH